MLECMSMHLHVWVYALCTPQHSHLSSHPVYAYTYIHVSPPPLFLYVLYICVYVFMHFRLYVILLSCVIAFYFLGDYSVTFAMSCHVHICLCEFLRWWTYSSNCRLSNHFSSFIKYFNYVSKCQVYAMMWHACFQ